MNAFRLEDVGTEYSLNRTQPEEPEYKRDVAVGLYELPSYCNHSCVPSASKVFFGDVMVARANKTLKAGDEVTLSYLCATQSYEQRTAFIQRKWGSPCNCVLCKADRSDRAGSRKLRTKMLEKPTAGTIDEAKKRIAKLKNSYRDSPERRLCGVKPELFLAYLRLSLLYKKEAEDNRWQGDSLERSAEAALDTLEALGVVVKDRGLSGRSHALGCPMFTDLPVDVRSPIPFPHICVPVLMLLAGVFTALKQEGRVSYCMHAVMCSELYPWSF